MIRTVLAAAAALVGSRWSGASRVGPKMIWSQKQKAISPDCHLTLGHKDEAISFLNVLFHFRHFPTFTNSTNLQIINK